MDYRLLLMSLNFGLRRAIFFDYEVKTFSCDASFKSNMAWEWPVMSV